MGHTKRFVSEDFLLKKYKENVGFEEIFKSDALIFLDDFSSQAFKLYCSGLSDFDILKTIENNKKNENNKTKVR